MKALYLGALTKKSDEEVKLAVLYRRLKKADDVARIIKEPARETLRTRISLALEDVKFWMKAPQPWE
jgi:hypothetical protein